MSLTIGVDIGTFEAKAVLVRASDGAILARASRPHPLHVPQPGYAEHDAEEDWWVGCVALVQALLQKGGAAGITYAACPAHAAEGAPSVDPASIAAVAVSAIGPCMLPLDEAGAPLCRAVLYGVDTRAAAQIAALEAALGRPAILQACGNALTSQSVGPKILWLRQQRPDIFARTRTIVSATTFLTHRLTGALAMDHLTAAGFAPLYNVHTQQWQEELGGRALDIVPLRCLPRLAWATELLPGGVCAAAAAATGLRAGTPVTVGTIDAAAEAVSVGVVQPRDAMVMYGSTVFIVALTEALPRALDGALFYSPWLFPGQHSLNAGLATSGTLTHWFRSTLCSGSAGAAPPSFEALAAEAAASPRGAKGLLCLPHFSGERTPLHDPLALGAFFGLTLAHTRGDLYRALLEGVAAGTAQALEALEAGGALEAAGGGGAEGHTPQQQRALRAVGGGTRNAVWMQATSDFSGRAQEVCRESLGACLGDAFLAALAVGLEGAREVGAVRAWNPVVPELGVAAAGEEGGGRLRVYARQYRLWKALYTQTRDIAHALSSGGAGEE